MANICFIDVETNGRSMLAQGQHRIVELAYILTDGRNTVEFDKFVKQNDIGGEITALTGITRNDIWKYGVPEYDIALHLRKLMQLHPVMVAHNVQFDLHMIFDLLCRQLGQSEAYNLVSNCAWIDTLTIARDRWAHGDNNCSHRLTDCIKHYNITGVVNSHRALDDVKALRAVYREMMIERPDAVQYINIFGYNPNYPHNEEFGFITYKPQSNDHGFVSSDEILPII